MQELSIKELSNDIKQAIEHIRSNPEIENIGIVTRIGWYRLDLWT